MQEPNATTQAKAGQRVREVTPTDARQLQLDGAILLDVREENERALGAPSGSIAMPRDTLATQIAKRVPDRQQKVLTICARGQRSALAAATLASMGYTNVASIEGGFQRWQREGLPVQGNALSADSAERYARQLILPQVGVQGQAKLAAARIAVVGAGGLGAPLSMYLAAAGVGHLTLIDNDHVERSNLHRQIVHTDARVGMAKTESARTTLAALNPSVHVELRDARLDAQNAKVLLRGHDIIIDGADNFPTRYAISAASLALRVPMVYGAVERFAGQASVFDPRDDTSPCYRCLFPFPPAPEDAPNCSEAGVLGVLPGLVGMIQATETLKLLLDLGDPLTGRILGIDALNMRFTTLKLPRDPECPGCGPSADRAVQTSRI